MSIQTIQIISHGRCGADLVDIRCCWAFWRLDRWRCFRRRAHVKTIWSTVSSNLTTAAGSAS